MPLNLRGSCGRFTSILVVYGMFVQPYGAVLAGQGVTTSMPVGVYWYRLPVPEMKADTSKLAADLHMAITPPMRAVLPPAEPS